MAGSNYAGKRYGGSEGRVGRSAEPVDFSVRLDYGLISYEEIPTEQIFSVLLFSFRFLRGSKSPKSFASVSRTINAEIFGFLFFFFFP